MSNSYIQNVGFQTVQHLAESGGDYHRHRVFAVEFCTRERMCNVFSSDYDSLTTKVYDFMKKYYPRETILDVDCIEPVDDKSDSFGVWIDMSNESTYITH